LIAALKRIVANNEKDQNRLYSVKPNPSSFDSFFKSLIL